ncbi:PilW family protein [Delftia acidovorans]|uniref:Prepilin-type N-terminal cleavage/methylation domain-containing protein n=1 Tax=Delftia acidovorans TaxID=80866 RepID=A0AAJ2R0V9_DELAC|nr:prepilin-type N-terminal cleavage/methylation domain-containing protein [Delftia acidovorans]MDX4953878.1 prepilin-type N-terminal cleavage/methylation domain-containing protein [Delftia acidovorans]
MRDRLASRGPQQGLTLVELMVAVVIALFLLAALAGLYVNARGLLRHENALARMQSDARLSFGVMGQAVRNAGFTGCSTALSKVPPFIAEPLRLGRHWNLLDPIGIRRGQAQDGWTSFAEDVPAQASARSDVLRTAGTGTHKSSQQLSDNDVVVATDCSQTYISRRALLDTCIKPPPGSGISGFSPDRGACGLTPLKRDARVLPAINDLFFIGRLKDGSATGLIHCSSSLIDPKPGHRKANDLSCRMLAEGAVDLKIESIHGQPSAAVQQKAPGNSVWNNTGSGLAGRATTPGPTPPPPPPAVRAVEVRLLMASAPGMGALLHAPQSYTFYRDSNGAPRRTTAADRRLYREFSAVFTLRNRVE